MSTTFDLNDAVKQVAETTRHAAAAGAGAVAGLVGEVQHRLEDVSLPVVHAPKRRRRRGVVTIVLVLGGVAVAYFVRRKRSGDDRSFDLPDATNSDPIGTPMAPVGASAESGG